MGIISYLDGFKGVACMHTRHLKTYSALLAGYGLPISVYFFFEYWTEKHKLKRREFLTLVSLSHYWSHLPPAKRYNLAFIFLPKKSLPPVTIGKRKGTARFKDCQIIRWKGLRSESWQQQHPDLFGPRNVRELSQGELIWAGKPLDSLSSHSSRKAMTIWTTALLFWAASWASTKTRLCRTAERWISVCRTASHAWTVRWSVSGKTKRMSAEACERREVMMSGRVIASLSA